MDSIVLTALGGGVLIGLAASMFLLFSGRVTGISGILGGLLIPHPSDWGWRLAFVVGLLSGGAVLAVFRPESFSVDFTMPLSLSLVAGFLVGFGTLMANGCTSGHGVCGVARLSARSLLATGVFMAAGVLTVALLRRFG